MIYYKAKEQKTFTNNKKYFYTTIKNELLTEKEHDKILKKLKNNKYMLVNFVLNFDTIELPKNKTVICFGVRQLKQL